jgi:ParB-like chromosome segregation protein Spo0J
MHHTNTNTTTAAAHQVSEMERAIIRLEQQATHAEAFGPTPERVLLSALTRAPEAFNVRGEPLVEYQLHHLGRALAVQGDLTPILVLPIGRSLLIVDGHHRAEAYRRAKREAIPVEVFNGSVREAVLEAAARNTRTVLPMDNRQRQDLAWRLVNCDFTLNQITRATGIARSQVGIMRKVKRALGNDAAGRSWGEARNLANGREPIEYTHDEREEMMSTWQQNLADRFRRAFGNRLAKQPAITAGALAIYLGRSLPEVVRELHQHLTEDPFEDEEYEF